jgi:16S rRNA (guanine966-N2)-methyltransferase
MNRRAPTPARPAGQVRIIGGRWRGSKLPVPGVEGLRPTADRVRETLFNWLQPELAGTRVLDLFAGSGALGFEAASRGAAQVDLVESSPAAVAALRESAARLTKGDGDTAASTRIAVHPGSAAAFLDKAAHGGARWDVVFIDPPFAGGLWNATLAALPPCLAPHALVYVESGVDTVLAVPAGWAPHRELTTREAQARLYRVGPA